MTLISVDVCIRGGTHLEVHSLFCNHKLHHRHNIASIFVNHIEPVIAAHLKPAFVIRDIKFIVSIFHTGVDGVLIVVDGIVIESFQPVAVKDILRLTPVGLTMFKSVDISVIVMR